MTDRLPSSHDVSRETPAPFPTRSGPALFLDAERRLRTLWRFAIFGAGFFVVQLVVGLATVIVLVVALAVTGQPLVLEDQLAVEELTGDWTIVLTIVAAAPLTLLTFSWCVICRRFLDRRPISSMGFVRRQSGWRSSLVVGFLCGLLPLTGVALLAWAVGGFRSLQGAMNVQTLLFIPTLVMMAFMEEIVFRGYLLQNLLDLRRPVAGVLLTSVVFWLLHGLNPHVWSSWIIPINMIGAGVILALAYIATENIWFPTALHFGWNAAQGVVFGIPVSGVDLDGVMNLQPDETMPVWLNGGAFGLEGSLLVTGMELIMGFLFLVILRSPGVSNRLTQRKNEAIENGDGDPPLASGCDAAAPDHPPGADETPRSL